MPPLLQPKWEIACLSRANGDTTKNAYKAAGLKYNPGNSNRFFNRPEIVNRIAEIQTERREQDARARQVAAEESGVDLAWTEKHYKYIVLGALRGDPVRDSTGRIRKDPETGAPIYRPDRHAAVKALDSLTRMKGGFIDRTEIGGPGDFSRMADDDLDKEIVVIATSLGLPANALKALEHLTKREAAE